MKCPNCGAMTESAAKFCSYCGYELPKTAPDTVVHDNSNTVVHQTINNYYYDPNPLPRSQQGTPQVGISNVSEKSQSIALILAILGGVLGIHRFYAGRIVSGILYLFTGGCFIIGWILDIIAIASGTFKDSYGLCINDRLYNRNVEIAGGIPRANAFSKKTVFLALAILFSLSTFSILGEEVGVGIFALAVATLFWYLWWKSSR